MGVELASSLKIKLPFLIKKIVFNVFGSVGVISMMIRTLILHKNNEKKMFANSKKKLLHSFKSI